MRRISRACLSLALLAAVGLPLAGCGGSNARPKGQVLQDGHPYPFADDERMAITFTSTAGKGMASVSVNKDGSFAVAGDGLMPGPYTVNVVSNLTNSKDPYKDKFDGVFTGPNDPLKIDIPEGASAPVVEIDLGKKTATVK